MQQVHDHANTISYNYPIFPSFFVRYLQGPSVLQTCRHLTSRASRRIAIYCLIHTTEHLFFVANLVVAPTNPTLRDGTTEIYTSFDILLFLLASGASTLSFQIKLMLNEARLLWNMVQLSKSNARERKSLIQLISFNHWTNHGTTGREK
jgi:hypothetical protein